MNRSMSRWWHLGALLTSGAILLAIGPSSTRVTADAADLFISEYVEGSSNNKAIEIYNGTSAPIDLGASGYNVQISALPVGGGAPRLTPTPEDRACRSESDPSDGMCRLRATSGHRNRT